MSHSNYSTKLASNIDDSNNDSNKGDGDCDDGDNIDIKLLSFPKIALQRKRKWLSETRF